MSLYFYLHRTDLRRKFRNHTQTSEQTSVWERRPSEKKSTQENKVDNTTWRPDSGTQVMIIYIL